MYEAYIEDSKSRRIGFSRRMKPEWRIDFVFKRRGNARVTIISDKKVLEVIKIEADEFD